MASDVDICNIGLSTLGNKATVVSISPVDGSVEADLCARFYPIARQEILEAGDWTFARTRVTLAELSTNPTTVWTYAYQMPSDCVSPRRIPTGIISNHDDDSADFDIEGTTLLTNQESAVLIYTRLITDPTKFSAGFITALGYKLAAYLAGPILRGESGTNAAKELHAIAAKKVQESMGFDASRAWRAGDSFTPSSIIARNGALAGSSALTNEIIYPQSGYAIS